MLRVCLAATVLALFGSPALAVEANCLLSQMTDSQKEAVKTAYATGGIRALANSAELTIEQIVPCIGRPSTERELSEAGFQVGIALSATRREFATGDFLIRKYGLAPRSLDMAWERISPQDRNVILSVVSLPSGEETEAEQGVIDDAYVVALERLAQAAGLVGQTGRPASGPDFRVVLDHYLARAVREKAEATLR